MKRLFVAVDLPETIKTALAQLAAGIPGARWTEPPQIHLTLRFIGDVDGAQFADIREALAEVNALAFALSLSGTDHFASQQTPRTFWAGVAPSLELERLHADVERALSSAGLKPERHKFIPHVTLARLKRAPLERVRRTLIEHAGFKTAPFAVDEFVLYSSFLSRNGAIHTPEAAYHLQQPSLASVRSTEAT